MSTTICVFVFFLISSFTLTSGVGNIHTIADLSDAAFKGASTTATVVETTTAASSFQGTGYVVGGAPAVPNTIEAVRQARINHFERASGQTTSILTMKEIYM